MARKLVVTVVDDLDGESVAAETVSFGIDGLMYEIDLSEANARELRAVLSKWTPFARKVGRLRRARREIVAQTVSAKVVREWARGNGFEVPDRGRIPSAVRDSYQRAMS
ncbi:histone-like nucleoid-structuring protein Lsr2 [Nocardia sp. NBC_00416]|uniref:histone-like nucleoid-structuring protein Lsr2 n=1 Tax=Nocardia sp. NBC_00416 TaxID=2975991 RepID=UPI002E2362EA